MKHVPLIVVALLASVPARAEAPTHPIEWSLMTTGKAKDSQIKRNGDTSFTWGDRDCSARHFSSVGEGFIRESVLVSCTVPGSRDIGTSVECSTWTDPHPGYWVNTRAIYRHFPSLTGKTSIYEGGADGSMGKALTLSCEDTRPMKISILPAQPF